MAEMPEGSVDSIVTDPPYGLSFMGKGWDHGVPGVEFWEAALRVAKPGAHLLAFGGTRTYHRLACAIEDAGWEVRDCIMWVYGSGFPKSHDVSKAIDREAGAEREVIGISSRHGGGARVFESQGGTGYATNGKPDITAPATDAARQWSGWGTALKPSHEPVILARKPLPEDEERATIVENLSRLESRLCLLMSDAWLAEASLMSSLAVERLLAIARWTAEDRTNTRADLFGQMDMSQCELVIRFCLNTVSSWKGIWEDASIPTSTFITAMASSTTIGWKTLRSCVSALTLPCIIRAASKHGGSWPDVVPAAAIFNAVSASTNSIRTLSAHASAIEQGLAPRPDAIDHQRLHRPIILARKPFPGTVAANVLEWGTGAINVDGCRVGTESTIVQRAGPSADLGYHGNGSMPSRTGSEVGRWPANLIHDGSDEVVGLFPDTTSGSRKAGRHVVAGGQGRYGEFAEGDLPEVIGDSGSAARFFYCPKASKQDRDEGCDSNHHPTVKPTDLMRYLCRLVTPPGGLVLDPFGGSGSTGKAALLEGFRVTLCELSEEYWPIIKARCKWAASERPDGKASSMVQRTLFSGD